MKEANKTVSEQDSNKLKLEPLSTKFEDLYDRGISETTARKYGVYLGSKGYVYPYYTRDGKQYIANKIRKEKVKEFYSLGVIQQSGLFGQQLFPPGSAKAITVTEGEDDAMAASEIQGNRYPVVSVKNGAQAAVKDCLDNYEYLNSFDEIVLCFDKDEAHVSPTGSITYPGQDAAIAVASLFPLGKVKVLTLKLFKDARDYLLHGKNKEFINEWWQSPVFKPSGLRFLKDMWDLIVSPKKYESIPYPWQTLNKQTYGMRQSEFVLLTAEPGAGKTTILKEMAYPLIVEYGKKVGFLFFEELNEDTTLSMLSIAANKPLHLPDVREHVTEEELRKYFNLVANNDLGVIWDHFGSNSIHEVLAKIDHLAALGCTHIFLDHLSIIVSDQSGDERKQLDEISTKLKTKLMERDIWLCAVIHKSRSGLIRGSMGPEQLANLVIDAERDKDHLDPWVRNVTKMLLKKNRFTGRTGPSSYVFYDEITGRLIELNEEEIKRYEEQKE